jgi:hypothetical protein
MNKLVKILQESFVLTVILFISASNIFAAHPLITDDTGTQGKGKIQLELNGEYGIDKEDGTTEKTATIAGAFTYGLIDTVDLIAGIPYLIIIAETDEENIKEKGISDLSFFIKWRFFEEGKFGFAFKSGISIPTGNEEKGLGTGKTGYSGLLINTIKIEPFTFHLNFCYIRNENKSDEEKNLWHFSGAIEYSLLYNLRIVADAGIQKNTDPDSNTNPAYLICGIIYSVKENFDIDAGAKYGLNKPETDLSFLAGITIRL